MRASGRQPSSLTYPSTELLSEGPWSAAVLPSPLPLRASGESQPSQDLSRSPVSSSLPLRRPPPSSRKGEEKCSPGSADEQRGSNLTSLLLPPILGSRNSSPRKLNSPSEAHLPSSLLLLCLVQGFSLRESLHWCQELPLPAPKLAQGRQAHVCPASPTALIDLPSSFLLSFGSGTAVRQP